METSTVGYHATHTNIFILLCLLSCLHGETYKFVRQKTTIPLAHKMYERMDSRILVEETRIRREWDFALTIYFRHCEAAPKLEEGRPHQRGKRRFFLQRVVPYNRLTYDNMPEEPRRPCYISSTDSSERYSENFQNHVSTTERWLYQKKMAFTFSPFLTMRNDPVDYKYGCRNQEVELFAYMQRDATLSSKIKNTRQKATLFSWVNLTHFFSETLLRFWNKMTHVSRERTSPLEVKLNNSYWEVTRLREMKSHLILGILPRHSQYNTVIITS